MLTVTKAHIYKSKLCRNDGEKTRRDMLLAAERAGVKEEYTMLELLQHGAPVYPFFDYENMCAFVAVEIINTIHWLNHWHEYQSETYEHPDILADEDKYLRPELLPEELSEQYKKLVQIASSSDIYGRVLHSECGRGLEALNALDKELISRMRKLSKDSPEWKKVYIERINVDRFYKYVHAIQVVVNYNYDLNFRETLVTNDLVEIYNSVMCHWSSVSSAKGNPISAKENDTVAVTDSPIYRIVSERETPLRGAKFPDRDIDEASYYHHFLEQGRVALCKAVGMNVERYGRDRRSDGECYVDCFRDMAAALTKFNIVWNPDSGEYIQKVSK